MIPGRRHDGAEPTQPATVEVGYVYPAWYEGTTSCTGTTGCSSHATKSACEAASCTWTEPIFATPPETSYVTADQTRENLTLWTVWKGTLGALDATKLGFGGWSVNVHHAYSRSTETLFYGWGGHREAKAIGDVLTTVAGKIPGSSQCIGGCFGAGLEGSIDFGPNGELYITEKGGPGGQDGVVKKFEGGVMTTIIASGQGLSDPQDVAATADGKLYIADSGNHQVFRWDGSGALDPVAGTGAQGNGGDGQGTGVDLNGPYAVEIGPGGAIYIADTGNNKIRRLDASGYLKRVAGNAAGTLAAGGEGDGFAATDDGTRLYHPRGLAFGPDGSMYISHYTGTAAAARIRRVAPDGIISTYAGGGTDASDGARADLARLDKPSKLAFARDGSLYFAQEGGADRIRRVTSGSKDGALGSYVATVAGAGNGTCPAADGTPAVGTTIQTGSGIAIDAQGFLNFADYGCKNVRRITPAQLGQDGAVGGELAVPSEDGAELYIFDEVGRHLRTEDALVKDLTTGKPAVRFEFIYTDYDAGRLLTQIRDRRGTVTATEKVTTIARDGSGTPTSITAPSGQATGLTVTNGYLEAVIRPSSLGIHAMVYDNGTGTGLGLLTQLTDPRAKVFKFEYSTSTPAGRLLKDRDPLTASGAAYLSLDQSVLPDGWRQVEATTSKGIKTKFERRSEPDGSVSRRVIRPDSTATIASLSSSGTSTVTLADGTEQIASLIKDQRFGIAAATSEVSRELPGAANKKLIVRSERSVSGQSGLQEFTTLTETRTTIPGAPDPNLTHTTRYDRSSAPHYIRTETPEGRVVKQELDSYGRVQKIYYTDLHTSSEVDPVEFGYDSKGRITTVTQQNRRTTFEWDANTGFLEFTRRGTVAAPNLFYTQYVTDPLGRTRSVFRNDVSAGTEVKLDYDGNSNLSSVQIPTGSTWQPHGLGYTDVNRLHQYNPPDVPFVSSDVIDYGSDTDRRATFTEWADNGGFSLIYDDPPTGTTGRLKEKQDLTTLATIASYGYDPNNGKLISICTQSDCTSSGIKTSYNYDGTGIQNGWSGLLFQVGTSWAAARKDVTYTYDAYLRRKTESVTGGQPVTFGYDDDSLVTSVQVGSLATLSLPSRSTQSGRLTTVHTGSLSTGVVTSYGYDLTYGDLTSLTTTYPGTAGNVLYSLTLGYDDLARVASKTENVQGSTATIGYVYDGKARLWKEQPQGFGDVEYKYDETGNLNGNRTLAQYPQFYPSAGSAFANQSWTYDAQDRISSATYEHDADGRRTYADPLDMSYYYDAHGRLEEIGDGNGLRVNYTYDALGRRVTRKHYYNNVLQSERRYLYDQEDRLVAVYDGSGNLQQQFV